MNIDIANKSIKNEADKYNKIKNIFTKLKDAESLNSKQRIEYFENLFEIKEHENGNKDLKKIFNLFREGMKNLESNRDEHLKTISDIIIPVTEMFPSTIKKQKNNLDDLALKRKNGGKIIEKDHEKIYKKFLYNSINDSKYILMNYIFSELKYHATLMEELNNLFFEINDIEPLVHLKKFGKNYGINNYDISKLKGVDMERVEAKEKKIKENKEQEKSGVYPNEEGSEEEIATSVKKSKNSSIKKSKNKKNNKSKNSKISSEDNEEIKESATSDKKIDED